MSAGKMARGDLPEGRAAHRDERGRPFVRPLMAVYLTYVAVAAADATGVMAAEKTERTFWTSVKGALET
ncbi:hypothetical protein AwMethylo_20390 [Methylobacterium sp.]|nr:hypothetical protein AwMethylo_20390 [Methylobacterium sp.]